MTCIACLRILPDLNGASGETGTASLSVRRSVAAFLVSRWSRPRRFGEIAPGAFLLSDPQALRLDARMLAALAAELAREPVTLALLEGDQDAATVFAALHAADLRSVLTGLLVVDEMPGRLSRVTQEGLQPVETPEGRTPLRLILEGKPPSTDSTPVRAAI